MENQQEIVLPISIVSGVNGARSEFQLVCDGLRRLATQARYSVSEVSNELERVGLTEDVRSRAKILEAERHSMDALLSKIEQIVDDYKNTLNR